MTQKQITNAHMLEMMKGTLALAQNHSSPQDVAKIQAIVDWYELQDMSTPVTITFSQAEHGPLILEMTKLSLASAQNRGDTLAAEQFQASIEQLEKQLSGTTSDESKLEVAKLRKALATAAEINLEDATSLRQLKDTIQKLEKELALLKKRELLVFNQTKEAALSAITDSSNHQNLQSIIGAVKAIELPSLKSNTSSEAIQESAIAVYSREQTAAITKYRHGQEKILSVYRFEKDASLAKYRKAKELEDALNPTDTESHLEGHSTCALAQ